MISTATYPSEREAVTILTLKLDAHLAKELCISGTVKVRTQADFQS
jgi:hypothetical protein